jgi:uncharacterized radical SAM protein YgiQ
MKEMDGVYELPYQRLPHPFYGNAKIPAYEMIRFSVTIQRGCFGGCTFCSITEHEGGSSRTAPRTRRPRDRADERHAGLHGPDLGPRRPTANMYRLACKDKKIESACRRPSCVFPGICENLNTNHKPLIELYRKARAVPGVKKISIASGVRYDLATKSPEYIKELATHHVGGYLKIAPEHTEDGPLDAMMKPGIGPTTASRSSSTSSRRRRARSSTSSRTSSPAHPGTTDKDMLELALWLKRNDFRADQVQAFLPDADDVRRRDVPHGHESDEARRPEVREVYIPRSMEQRKLHKAFLRWHDANNWPLIRSALKRMGRMDLIGSGKNHLVPPGSPGAPAASRAPPGKPFATQHTRDVWKPKSRPGSPAAEQNRPTILFRGGKDWRVIP